MNAELTRALAFQRYRNLATLERAGARPMTHTPGPWTLTRMPGGSFHITADKDKSIHAGPMHEANARLIAAAPEMLAALQKFIDTVTVQTAGEARAGRDNFNDAMRTARAAIAKAEGRE